MIDIQPVPKSSRISEERASTIAYLLGTALGRKFPVAPEPAPTLSNIRDFVGRRDYNRVIEQLRVGEIPLRLYPILPQDVQDVLTMEDRERETKAPTASSAPQPRQERAGEPRAVALPQTIGVPSARPLPTEGYQFCPHCHSGEALLGGGKCSNCEEMVEPHESTFPRIR